MHFYNLYCTYKWCSIYHYCLTYLIPLLLSSSHTQQQIMSYVYLIILVSATIGLAVMKYPFHLALPGERYTISSQILLNHQGLLK